MKLWLDASDIDADGVTGPVDPPTLIPWSVTKLGPELWLDANGTVDSATWTDRSENGNHATALWKSDSFPNAQNGLPLMSYSGSNGEYHAFPNITDVRTVFWAVRRQTNKYSFFLGHTGSYHFHTDGGNKFWSNQYAHQT